MIKPFLIVLLLCQLFVPVHAAAQSQMNADIFDIEQNKIIRHVPLDANVQKEITSSLTHITGVYKKFRAIPTRGSMVRVPVSPPLLVQNQWFHGLVDEVIFIFPPSEDPYVLLFDDENRSCFFTFTGDTKELRSNWGIQ